MGSPPLSTKMVDVQAMPTMWPESMPALVRTDRRLQIAEGQIFPKVNVFADSSHFQELLDRSVSGDNHQSSLASLFENRQKNAVSLLRQQLDTLTVERLEAERRQMQILEENVYDPLFAVDGCSLSGESPPSYDQYVGDDGPRSWSSIPGSELSEMEGDIPAEYWRDRARGFAKLLSDSVHREEILTEKLNEFTSIPLPAKPLEELQQHVHRFDDILRFTLRKAPVVVGHQDNELRYRFVYNAFPSLTEEEVIGKTDIEIYKGAGVLELMDFKREVLRKGFPEKREISFNTDLFGEKTFLIAVEPVLSRAGESMGINYVAMDVSEQVDKRERLARIREQVAVQKAMETELHKTIHMTEETMRAKQMLATMSHEIRSPLSGVVSMAEVLATTKLDPEQRQLVEVMMSSGDLVLQLINDILDLSKVQSGAMKFEAKKFRPQEVVKHVLQMALASMQNKHLILEGRIYDNVPLEVIGDVLRIRQVFTNLVSNAIKFTHEGSVTINVRVAPSPVPTEISRSEGQVPIMSSETASSHQGSFPTDSPRPKLIPLNVLQEEVAEHLHKTATFTEGSSLPVLAGPVVSKVSSLQSDKEGEEFDTVWLQCDICDTGIGIPETALPSLFEKYTQASTTHARKYGGTGLGLAICKNLVELMGGSLTVTSEENVGSTFTFKLPIQVAREQSLSTGQLSEEVYNIMTKEATLDGAAENLASTKEVGYFHFTSKVTPISQPQSLTLSSRSSSTLMANSITSSSAASNSEEYFSKATSPCPPSTPTSNRLKEAKRVVSSKIASSLGSFQDSSPELMEVDSLASDSSGYIPGLSMPQCQSPGQSKVTQQGQVPSWSFPKARSSTGWGPTRKGRKSQERRAPSVPPAPSSSAATATTTERPQRPSRILLAEDNKVNVMVAQSMLKRLGHKLEVASNGADALQALQQKSYDLILMDVCMPVMDGLEATRRIRSYEQTGSWEVQDESEVKRTAEAGSNELSSKVEYGETTPCQSSRKRIPIIAMTANALADNMLECYKHGMDSFIAKPVTFTKLEQVLKQFIPCLDRTGSSSQPSMGVPQL